MTNDREIESLIPFDLLDREAERLDHCFTGFLSVEGAWAQPSRCEGWAMRDVLGHLRASEDYHRACLDGRVRELVKEYQEQGMTDVAAFNALGIVRYSGDDPADLLVNWRSVNAENRGGFRERGDGLVDTSIGDYPCRWQALHVASELATHADDIGAPVSDGERSARTDWRARMARFALKESKPELTVERSGAGPTALTRVSDGSTTLELSDEELIAGVNARLDAGSGPDDGRRKLLSILP